MQRHPKFLTLVFSVVFCLNGFGFDARLGAVNSSSDPSLLNTLAAKTTSAPTAGPDVLDLLCLGMGSIWMLIVLGVGLLVVKEVQEPLDVNS